MPPSIFKTPDLLNITTIKQDKYPFSSAEERFPDPLEYEKYKEVYKLDRSLLSHIKPSLKIMHPLPRVGEIDPELDDTKHAVYFQQAGNGIPIRKALLALVLGAIK